jgi:phenylalanyl-tRNA synthetase alpha chain
LTILSPQEILALAESLHPLERKVMALFKEGISLSEQQLLEGDPTLQPSQLSMALGWLQTKEILAIESERHEEWVSLTTRGTTYADAKNPALQILDEIDQKGPTPLKDLGLGLESNERSEIIGALKKENVISIQKGGIVQRDRSDTPQEFIQLQNVIVSLAKLNQEVRLDTLTLEDQDVIQLHHRKRSKSKGIFRVDERVIRQYIPTEHFGPIDEKLDKASSEEIGVLTPQMLKDGSWRGKSFRKYNIDLLPPRIGSGRRHPYQVFLNQVREKLVSMGFSEMQGPMIESEFWNMDALYMPQFHPAREIHDVYFVKGSLHDKTIPKELVDRVASTHESGIPSGVTTSELPDRPPPAVGGWGYKFDKERTRRLILRSQGTAVSSRTLANKPNIPGKYFSIARCFRYDQVDATHAPDFFQVEGIVLGPEIHFRTLLGLLTLFAKEVALAAEVKFLPAYFPFTEPSVEMHVAHPTLGWMELGGAGLFRPEVTQPLGVDVPVIAWGLGLDRLAMMALKINDIRDLFSTDLGLIREKQLPR